MDFAYQHPYIFWAIVGIIAGALAKYVIPGEGPGGILGDLIIGIVGAMVGGFVLGLIGLSGSGGFIGSIIVAFIGAVLVLWLVRMLTTKRTTV